MSLPYDGGMPPGGCASLIEQLQLQSEALSNDNEALQSHIETLFRGNAD